ncbi:DAK2 domain-containing protein [Paenibacillus sp. J31TS4]|uniref:DAK2 domain-containing protein n=1 Tax=Paenibacillus sp. J31TS4 TaxID=2807195 RepID=UPI001BCF68F0
MVLSGASRLQKNVNNVNALNVFPVPDGDTGTNMNLTMTSGAEELTRRQSAHIGKAAEALSKGLLMGARGNSGVILSQLFRGFAKSVQELEEVNPQQFAAALQKGVDTAYQAVVKPVEGTVLTVAREAAKHATSYARRATDIVDLMQEVLKAGKETLARTPDMLPVLKQVGVVDAGGQGLIFIYEGFVAALTGQAPAADYVPASVQASSDMPGHDHATAQSMLATEDIEHGYCTEFMVKLGSESGKPAGAPFDAIRFRTELEKLGDSLLVVADDELVKIHIHAEHPGDVMNYAMKFGELTRIKIENMREQHSHILQTNEYDPRFAPVSETEEEESEQPKPLQPYGFVAVSAGEGIREIFSSLGVQEIIAGGQTMNPSTEDIVQAIGRVPAQTVFVFPNNSNIVMAARQAKELVEDKTVIVIPSKTIPQGMASLLAFQETASPEDNEEAMAAVLQQIKSGQVTFAVRDTEIDGIAIKEGDYLGIFDGRIVAARPDLLETSKQLLDAMLADGGDIVTILSGEDAETARTEELQAYIGESYPETEIETHDGGQPLYVYLFAVE